jgi:hypothetical protein
MSTETGERVYDLLHRMPRAGLAAAKQLFWTELNYGHANRALSDRGWPDQAREALAEPPVILAQHGAEFGSFDVIYARLVPEQRGRDFPLSLTAERLVINQLLNNHPYALFVFSDPDERHWHLLNVHLEAPQGRRVQHRFRQAGQIGSDGGPFGGAASSSAQVQPAVGHCQRGPDPRAACVATQEPRSAGSGLFFCGHYNVSTSDARNDS